jgi:hypothetical protein
VPDLERGAAPTHADRCAETRRTLP